MLLLSSSEHILRCDALLRPTYRNLEDELLVAVHGLKGVENRGKLVGVELDCFSRVSLIVSLLEAPLQFCELRQPRRRRLRGIFAYHQRRHQ
jgi:hypothetical protein